MVKFDKSLFNLPAEEVKLPSIPRSITPPNYQSIVKPITDIKTNVKESFDKSDAFVKASVSDVFSALRDPVFILSLKTLWHHLSTTKVGPKATPYSTLDKLAATWASITISYNETGRFKHFLNTKGDANHPASFAVGYWQILPSNLIRWRNNWASYKSTIPYDYVRPRIESKYPTMKHQFAIHPSGIPIAPDPKKNERYQVALACHVHPEMLIIPNAILLIDAVRTVRRYYSWDASKLSWVNTRQFGNDLNKQWIESSAAVAGGALGITSALKDFYAGFNHLMLHYIFQGAIFSTNKEVFHDYPARFKADQIVNQSIQKELPYEVIRKMLTV